MTMLIRGGLLHTMTEQGSFVGDVLIQGSCIKSIAHHIEPPKDCLPCILDAHGLIIMPGMIDMHIQDSPETDDIILGSRHAAGVTTGLLWPEEEGQCMLLTSGNNETSRVFAIKPDAHTEGQLHERFISMANEGLQPACEITDADMCRRVLQTVHSTGVKAILAQCCGCEEMLEAIALSGCAAVLGNAETRACSPWTMAAQLEALGVKVCLSCNYPAAKLCRLPLCASLCAREATNRESVLGMVTRAPGAILGLTGAGYIAVDGRADLAIYDGDPLLLATSHVMTIRGGKICH